MATITAENGGGNWSESGTWVGGAVPDQVTDTVIIPATLTAAVTINDSRTIPATTIEDEVYGLVQGNGVTTTLGGILTVGNGASKDGIFTFGAAATLANGGYNVVLNNCKLRSNSTSGSWAYLTGTGSIVLGVVYSDPKQDIAFSYVSVQGNGSNTVYFTVGASSGGVTPGYKCPYCVFYNLSSLTIGHSGYTGQAISLVGNNCDYRDIATMIIGGINAQTAGVSNFQNCVFTADDSGALKGVQMYGRPRIDFTGSIFAGLTLTGSHTAAQPNLTGTFFTSYYSGGSSQIVYSIGPSYTGDQIINDFYVYHPGSNPHPFSTTSTKGKITFSGGMFEMSQASGNAILLASGAGTDIDISGNIVTDKGVLFTLLANGSGTGKTLNISSNTTLTTAGNGEVHQGLLMLETTGDWVGTLNIKNNIAASIPNAASGLLSSTGTGASATIATFNNNAYYGFSAVENDPNAQITISSDADNINVNPSFADATRKLGTWGQIIHGTDGSASAAIAKLLTINGYDSSNKTQSDTPSGSSIYGTATSLVNWVRAGFVPRNMDLLTAGEAGTYIGAMEPQAAASDYYGAALLMGM